MLTCPLCKKELESPAPRCPRCQADLSLLAEYMTDLRTILDSADAHRRAGAIGPAVSAYCAALDLDPANAEARAALGDVVLALRATQRLDGRRSHGWAVVVLGVIVALAAAAFAVGYWAARAQVF
jgi:hypothetical protein